MKLFIPFFLFVFFACDPVVPEIITRVDLNQKLPEDFVTHHIQSSMQAWYVAPTTRYDHGILGDNIEAGGIKVVLKKVEYAFYLDSTEVFEDLYPRLKDLDGDSIPEIITLQSSLTLGGSIAIYKIENNDIVLWAQSDYIGRPFRWQNLAAISDLDGDGDYELAWVETPHIGGILKIGEVVGNKIEVIDEIAGVSNHQIGSSNLDLSLIYTTEYVRFLYLPTDSFDAIVGFRFLINQVRAVDTIKMMVDADIPLSEQINLD